MSAAEPVTNMTPEEYLAMDRAAETRSEYWQGQPVAMAGASLAHVLLVSNLLFELRKQLGDGRCRAGAADMRVRAVTSRDYFYPDLVVFCGQPEFADEQQDVLLNPSVVIEVLSPSTEAFDRGVKAAAYRRLPSLQHLLLVAQDRAAIELHSRAGEFWSLTDAIGLEAGLDLTAIDCRLEFAAVYQRIEVA